MERCMLILLIFCVIQTGYSQTEKGKRLIGGQISLAGSSDNSNRYDYKNKSMGLKVSPNFGYFIADNFAIGLNVYFGMSSSTEQSSDPFILTPIPGIVTYKTKSFDYGLGGFARYYKNITDKFKFYLNGGLNYTYGTSVRKLADDTLRTLDNQTNSISVVISPGLVYFVTPKLGIETSFGSLYYSYSQTKNQLSGNQSNSSNYGIDFNLSTFYLGLNYYF